MKAGFDISQLIILLLISSFTRRQIDWIWSKKEMFLFRWSNNFSSLAFNFPVKVRGDTKVTLLRIRPSPRFLRLSYCVCSTQNETRYKMNGKK